MDLLGDLRRTGLLIDLVNLVAKVERSAALGFGLVLRADTALLYGNHFEGSVARSDDARIHLGQAVALGHSRKSVRAALFTNAGALEVVLLDGDKLAVEVALLGGAAVGAIFRVQVVLKAAAKESELRAEGAHGGGVLGPVDDGAFQRRQTEVVLQNAVAAHHQVPTGGILLACH